ncbi:sugar transferase [Actinobacillus arthritidis]|uniref:sugar transferase n=1 Tax=Actinobacillus arthritidis TaxID=157339 RepID=UPI002441ED97|nr:sugar transferase [Actinobacillus arthritidis]WGE89331.1 sugar transferase [Actinobacillus arthritidis]
MKKYQIVELSTEHNHAGSKAVQDVYEIALSLGYEENIIRTATTVDSFIAKIQRQILFLIDWIKVYLSIEANSVVLIQNPYHHKQLIRNWVLNRLKRTKKVKFISLVHDVEELRKSLYSNYYKNEFETMLSLADSIIVHNDKMKSFFIKKGYSEDKLISLGIFDYLQKSVDKKRVIFERAISVAGNLDIKKSAYIAQLGSLGAIKAHLYGPNFEHSLEAFPNIEYHGSFPATEIPQKLVSGFGLVWDGQSIETCTGDFGEYLQYNNPHKLSLYLSSGMPVVIWDKVAEADFVKKHNVGLCVSSLNELQDKLNVMTEQEFEEMVNNVEKQTAYLMSGEYTKKAISEAERVI